jgi:uncharacterized glyoxalase superfamily protein PhnB
VSAGHALDPRELALVAPELFVPDVRAAAGFYERLGFTALRVEADGSFAVVARGAAVVLLAHESLFTLMGGSLAGARGVGIDVRFLVDDVDLVYRAARAAGAEIVHDLGDRPYGLRDFILRDPHGYRLRFAAPLR